MKIADIKILVEKYKVEELTQAEEHLLEEKPLQIDVSGADDGEKLTHLLAAIWIKQEMEEKNIPLNQAVRNYSLRVRTSIS